MADALHIQAPDGSIVEFPAGTSDATIKSAMTKAYPAPRTEIANVDASGNATGSSFAEGADAPAMGYGDQMRHVGHAVDSTVRSIANGIPFMDRIAAAAGATTGIGGKFGDYSGNLEAQRGEDKKLEEASPILNTAGHFVGGALVPVGAMGLAAKGASLGAKTVMSALTGGPIGGVQGLSGTKDLTDIPQAYKDTLIGARDGMIVAGLIPGASKIIGTGYEKAANAFRGNAEGMSRAVSQHLINAVEADGPAAVQARLQELGPDAMLADAGPAFLGKAQGASLNSDEGRSVMQTALTARNEGTNTRVQSDVNRALGPAEDPQTVTDAIKAHRTAIDSVNYPAALDNAPQVKIAPIMTDLIDRVNQAPVGSMEHKALTNLQSMLTKTEKQPLRDASGYPVYDKFGNERFHDVPSSHDDAGILHKVKGELDNVIEYDAPGLGVPAGALTRQQGALKQMRGAINDALEEQVPGYANANAVSAALAKRVQAIDAGTQYLGSGKTTSSPERFSTEFQRLEPGEQIAFAKGSRSEIERNLGTKANDLQALRGQLQGEGGWNTAKIGTVHGDDAANELMGTVDRNLKFRDTFGKVVENSQTAQRQAAANAMKPVPPGELPLINPNMTTIGFALSGAKKGLNVAYNAMRPDPTQSYGDLARVLTSQGAARDAHIQAIVDALGKRQGNAELAPTAGNVGAVVAAILANGGLRNGPMQKRD